MKRVVTILILTLAAAGIASAQSVPAQVNYQGRLTDAAGAPITGAHTLALSLYAAPCATSPCGDSAVWGPQTLAGVQADQNGLFNVALGPVDDSARSLLEAFGGASRYLEVTVDGGTPILPRQQVLAAPFAVQAEFARFGVPPGTILPFAAEVVPPGYLPCDGSAVSRTTYAALFATLGSTWGAGDGSTTFNLPDFRGRFLRGWDGPVGTGRDPDATSRTACQSGGPSGNNIGTCQDDAFQGHWHRYYWYGVGGAAYRGQSDQGGAVNTTNPLSDQVREALSDGSHGTPRVSSETRPENASIRFIVKY